MRSKKRSVKEGLLSSLRSEKSSVEKRFERAEEMLHPSERAREKPAVKAPPAERVIRETYSMPSFDHDKIAGLKSRCLKAGIVVTKSEVLRAGLHALEDLSNEDLLKVFGALEKLKPGKRARAA